MSNQQEQKLLVGIMTVNKVMHYSLHNGYCICRGETENTRRDKTNGMTFKGTLAEYPEIGQVFCVKGTMEFDPVRKDKYFKLAFCRPQEAKTDAGWVEYLIKECPRVSEMRATELVEAFGRNVVDVLATSPDEIMNVKSEIMKVPIGRVEAEKIHNWAKSEQRMSRMKAWLYDKGLTYSKVAAIVIKYGHHAPTIVRNEPYRLAYDIDGIAFLTADKIARAVKVAPDAPMRIQAALLYKIKEQMDEGGHTCILRHELVRETCKLIGVHHSQVEDQINHLLSLGKLCDYGSPIEKTSQYPWLFEDVA